MARPRWPNRPERPTCEDAQGFLDHGLKRGWGETGAVLLRGLWILFADDADPSLNMFP